MAWKIAAGNDAQIHATSECLKQIGEVFVQVVGSLALAPATAVLLHHNERLTSHGGICDEALSC
ncbi:hypothetical protein PV410_32180 [Streptomyces sp. PA03-5A]|nr:hypothetical protein [Streptomyces sp. PA03-5A]